MFEVNFSLTGRCALITGAGRGIGLGIAQALAGAGCAVAIQDIDRDVAAREAQAIERDGGRAVALGGDVTDLSLARRLIGEAVNALGGLDILINNAAIQKKTESWLDLTVEDIERQIRADFIMPILLCQQAVPVFRQRGGGRIINVGSIQQKSGNEHMLAYAMCKAALENMTKALGRELAHENITVNLIAPGWFDTYRNRADFPSEEAKVRVGKRAVPLGRIGEPQDCAGLALLLCSEAGSYITGQSIFVDGGMSAW